jgi:hypothetical protein
VAFESGWSDPQTFLIHATEESASGSSEDILARLQDLEERAVDSELQLKSLQESAKKAEAAKKKFPTAVLNGAFQADAAVFNQDAQSHEVYGPIEGGADLRRARLGVSGAVSDRMNYFFQMDFGFLGRPTFTDVWAEFKEVGSLGNVRGGNRNSRSRSKWLAVTVTPHSWSGRARSRPLLHSDMSVLVFKIIPRIFKQRGLSPTCVRAKTNSVDP